MHKENPIVLRKYRVSCIKIMMQNYLQLFLQYRAYSVCLSMSTGNLVYCILTLISDFSVQYFHWNWSYSYMSFFWWEAWKSTVVLQKHAWIFSSSKEGLFVVGKKQTCHQCVWMVSVSLFSTLYSNCVAEICHLVTFWDLSLHPLWQSRTPGIDYRYNVLH